MRKRKRWLSLLLVLLLLLIFQRNVYLANDSLYEKMLQAYHNGQQMDDWVVEAVGKQIESVSNAFRTLNGDENTPFNEGRG